MDGKSGKPARTGGTPVQRLDYIDALRGFAILGVFATHVATVSGIEGTPLSGIMHLGAFGVQLFFMVSGFTIFLTFFRSHGREHAPVRNFLIRRLVDQLARCRDDTALFPDRAGLLGGDPRLYRRLRS